MNILHLKYAVEVAKAGSINKASDVLSMAQPNLSRAIKELEQDLGITIFERSARGMLVTPQGEEFLEYAQRILTQISEVESLYKQGVPVKQKFSISVPRASYISEAFARFTTQITTDPAEIFYMETNARRAIDNILLSGYKLGIIRYAEQYDKDFKSMLQEKGLAYETVTEFRYVLVMHRDNALASLPVVRQADLEPMIEIAHADPFVPSVPVSEARKEELTSDVKRRIFVFDRASQFDVLSSNQGAYMWVSSIPDRLLAQNGLVQKECVDHARVYRDVLIYQKDYRLSRLDNLFISELNRSKNQYL